MKWALQVNVAGVQPIEPGQYPQPPEGPYAVLINDSEQKVSASEPGRSSMWFHVRITEPGEAQGMEPNVIVGADVTKDGNRKHWRALLLGVGANPAALDSGTLNLTDDMFLGKAAYIYVSEPPPGATRADGRPGKPFNNINFVAPEYYAKKKAELAQQKAAVGAGIPAGGGGTPPPIFAASGLPSPNGAGAPNSGLGNLAANLGPGGAATGGPPLFGAPLK